MVGQDPPYRLVLIMRFHWALALALSGGYLVAAAGCSTSPIPHSERHFYVRLRVLDSDGTPVKGAEVWVDDGREIIVTRLRPGEWGYRAKDGEWVDFPSGKTARLSPGEIPWEAKYDLDEEAPTQLRILVIRNGVPVALVERPLTSRHSKLKMGFKRVETITLPSSGHGPQERNVQVRE